MLARLVPVARFATGLGHFLRQPLSEAESQRIIEQQLRSREPSFLHILERGVYANQLSPYRKLLNHAHIELRDVQRLVSRQGVEATLAELCEQGIGLSLEEFKGRKPIKRPGLEFPVTARDFDNPLLTHHYESRTGGSRGPRTRLLVDLDLLNYEAAHVAVFLSAFNLWDRPTAIWRELPPGLVGLKTWLRHAKLGRPVERWFTRRKPLARLEDLKFLAFTAATRFLSRWHGSAMPTAEYVPPGEARQVAHWLAAKTRRGTPALLDTNTSTGARVCLAAQQEGLDISGTFFRFSAEAYTPGRARAIQAAGCRAASFYAAGEVGHVGLACADPLFADEVHIMTDKVAVIPPPKPGGIAGHARSLLITTLLTSCPKLMLNVDLGDYGTFSTRSCACPLDRMGFHQHLHDIRSYEKMNSDGMTFLGTELVTLVEEVLPRRFGGTALDYQFVEEEQDGLARVSLLVSPHIGEIDEAKLRDAVLDQLSACPGGALMTDVWRESGTLAVIRREPESTAAFKLLPLHLPDKASDR